VLGLCAEYDPSERVLTRILNEPNENITRLIKDIQAKTNRKLIVYIANFNHPLGGIHLVDVLPFEEILRTIGPVKEIDLLLNSPGGEINATEKLVTMLRQRYDNIRVIVPNQAKSGATMIALASDQVMMGYLSELGPIDSIIAVQNPDGTVRSVPAQSIIDSIELMTQTIADAKKNGRPIEQFVAMAFRIDPSLWDMALKAQALSTQFAQKWLTKHMCKGDANLAKQITSNFMDVKKYLSHGRIIGVAEAKEILPKESIIELGKEDPLWNMFWELYVRCEWRINTQRTIKFFANERANMDIGAAVAVRRPPPPTPGEIPPSMPPPSSMPPPGEGPSLSPPEP
jgi:ATP-dependent protease ClpP protease subunit